MTILSNTRKFAKALGSGALLVCALGVFSGSAWAVLPPPPMAVNPIVGVNCLIYTLVDPTIPGSGLAGPFKGFGIIPPAVSDNFAANVCAEGDIRPGVGKFNAPTVDSSPSHLDFNTVALAAAGIIFLENNNVVAETHTVDVASAQVAGATSPPSNTIPAFMAGDPPHDGSRWYDVDLAGPDTSFDGPGVTFPGPIVSTGVDGEIFCKKNKLTVPNLSGKVGDAFDPVTGKKIGIAIEPGNYGAFETRKCSIFYVPAGYIADPTNPDLTVPLNYTFLYLISQRTAHNFTIKESLLPNEILSLLFQQFVTHRHPEGFNKEEVKNVTVWIDGRDSDFGGKNVNVASAVTGQPAVFQNGGDGAYYACHVYASQGSVNVNGHAGMTARLIGINVQKVGGQSVNIKHPQEVCGPNPIAQCLIINKLSCTETTLTIKGEGLTGANVSFLGTWDPATAGNIAGFLAGPAASATASVASTAAALTFNGSGTSLSLDPLQALGNGFTPNSTVTLFVGLIGPDTGPAITSGVYTRTDQALEVTTDGGGNITSCSVVTP